MVPLGIGLCGLGTVGGAVLRRLSGRGALPGVKLCAVAARHRRDHQLAGLHFSERPAELVENPEVQVVVELLGGVEAAAELVTAAIAAGKHVVTANKALLSICGEELLAAAATAGVELRFEAAVAGGVPVIKLLRESLVANRIDAVGGILNGTSNFVLSERRRTACSQAEAVAAAQAHGYAERDATLDVDGSDAADKLRILSRLAFGTALDVPLPLRQGIEDLSAHDFAVATELGCRLRPLALAERSEQGVAMGVFVALVPLWDSANPTARLAAVEDVENAVLLQADLVGELLCCGPGAGGDATASAVLADLSDIALGTRAQPLCPVDDSLPMLPPAPRPQCLWCVSEGGDSTALRQQLSEHLPAGVMLGVPSLVGSDMVMVLLRACVYQEADALCTAMAETLGARFSDLKAHCLPILAREGELLAQQQRVAA